MISYTIFIFILVHSSLANLEETYLSPFENYNAYTDEYLDRDDRDVDKNSNQFMRLGRNSGDFDNKEMVYDGDYDEVDMPKKRAGNQHLRFGRAGANAFMRLGRDHLTEGRNKAHFMRIGRNFQDHEEKIRSKRAASQTQPDTDYPKRKDHFMRFGKSSNFMRYGRDLNQLFDRYIQSSAFENEQQKESRPLTLLLAKLLARRQLKPFEVLV